MYIAVKYCMGHKFLLQIYYHIHFMCILFRRKLVDIFCDKYFAFDKCVICKEASCLEHTYSHCVLAVGLHFC